MKDLFMHTSYDSWKGRPWICI